MLGSLIILILLVIIWQPFLYHLDSLSIIKTSEPEKSKINFSLKENQSLNHFIKKNKVISQNELGEKNKLSIKIISNNTTHIHEHINVYEYVISIGDTLSNILNHYGISIRDVSQLISVDKELQNLKSGQHLSWVLATDHVLKRLTWKISHRETRIYNRVGDSFKINSKIQQGNWINYIVKGTVDRSFITSACNAGLINNEINTITKVMQWQIDFRKMKKGDQFSVLISREMFSGKREQSQLIGAHLRSRGKDYYAFRAEDGKFYDLNGRSLEKTFLRLPTERQFRISSHFNPYRLNPITGRISSHRGVDFAMPQGTPVLAVGDGEIIVAKRSNIAGLYITVRHSHMYTTRYMHLFKILVKQGQKVRRGDRIALSGNTGRSSGPHLHYEMWINKQAVNPLTARLPYTAELAGKHRFNYLAQVKNIIPQLRFE